MKNRYVRQGDGYQRFMQAGLLNEIIQSSDAVNVAAPIGAPRLPSVAIEQSANTVSLINDIATPMDVQHIRSIADPSQPPASNLDEFKYRTVLAGKDPVQGAFAVARQAASRQGDIGLAAGYGIVSVKLRIPANGSWIERADIDASDPTRLLATPNGSAQILWRADPAAYGTAETVDAIVRLGNRQNVQLTGKAFGGPLIANAATGNTVRVWVPTDTDTIFDIPDVQLDWMEGGLDVSEGKEVIITWFSTEGVWRVTHAECETDQPVLGQMTADGVGSGQGVANGVPEPIDVFDSEIATPGVTVTLATASIQIPDVTTDTLFKLELQAGLEVANNNVQVDIWVYLNGSPISIIGSSTFRQSGATGQIGASFYFLMSAQSSPTIALWVEADNATTITWYGMNANVTKWAEGSAT